MSAGDLEAAADLFMRALASSRLSRVRSRSRRRRRVRFLVRRERHRVRVLDRRGVTDLRLTAGETVNALSTHRHQNQPARVPGSRRRNRHVTSCLLRPDGNQPPLARELTAPVRPIAVRACRAASEPSVVVGESPSMPCDSNDDISDTTARRNLGREDEWATRSRDCEWLGRR